MNRQKVELLAIVLTAMGKFIFMDFMEWRLPFVATALSLWVLYILLQVKKNPKLPRYWGFRTDNFKSVLKRVMPFGILALLLSVGIGYFRGTLNIHWHIIPILLIYPIWGTIQQFLIMALVTGNLQDLPNRPVSKGIIVFTSAVLFGGIHYPHYWLILGTTLLALLYSSLYLKERNLYALGLFHGWLGAIFYYTILERDPFLEMFGGFG